VLSGSFREYPFNWLLEIFLHRKETGLLEVSSPVHSGYFYLKNGEIKDGEIGKLKGAEAIELARTCVDASFRFRRLDPTDYAQIVWQKSFGANNVNTPSPQAQIVRRLLARLLSYPIAAYGVLAGVAVTVVKLPVLPLLRYQRTHRNLAKSVVGPSQQTFAYGKALKSWLLLYSRAAYESLGSFGVAAQRMPAHLRYRTGAKRLLSTGELAARCAQSLRDAGYRTGAKRLLSTSEFAARSVQSLCAAGFRTGAKRLLSTTELAARSVQSLRSCSVRRLNVMRYIRTVVPSRQQLLQSNISFGVTVAAFLLVITACIYALVRTNHVPGSAFANTEENIGTESQATPRSVSTRRRANRKASNATPIRDTKQRDRQKLAAK
jgi:hypothetical protein